MPKTLADARTRLTILITQPATFNTPKLTELNHASAIDASCKVLKSDFRLSPTGSDTVGDTELCTDGNAVTFGSSNYEGTITPFWYLDSAGKTVTLEDTVYQALKVKGTRVWMVLREGPKYDAVWAIGDAVEVYEVITDHPQKPSDRAGYIKRVIPLGVQRAEINAVTIA